MKNTNILTPRQATFIQAYTQPSSPTFSNCYQSARLAGYSDKTARNLSHVRPSWFSEIEGQIGAIQPQQLTEVLTGVIYNESEPTIVRLRAAELMMKYYGMFQRRSTTTKVSVQLDLTAQGNTSDVG